MSLHLQACRSTKVTASPSSAPSSSAGTTTSSTSSNNAAVDALTVNTAMSLRRGAGFHSPSSPTDEQKAIKTPSLARRAQSTLDDVVDAHRRRMALTLGDIDRSLSSVDDKSPNAPSSSRPAFLDDAEPALPALLTRSIDRHDASQPIMRDTGAPEPALIGRHSLRTRTNRRLARYADSALGSSIESNSAKPAMDEAAVVLSSSDNDTPRAQSRASASTITRSASALTSTTDNLPRLSARANNRIHEHILRPLLAKKSLKDFHPIIRDCPRRIHNKEIACLRDLEKTLMFMAPERSKSAALYLDFCLTSIRCIQATVEFLSEREQTRPRDRPYTNGYFVDLVDQIKHYAQRVQATREQESKGEKDEMEPQLTDEITLHGGLSENGRPAELVRITKGGKAISLATGEPVDLEEDSKAGLKFKRSSSEEVEEDEAILRSMARRKRSASAADLAPKRCRAPGCDKEFKRPCDLTKHEKTHSRPWKCPVETCKYHEYGWPTEKEMDRHHNDKHSAAPALFECHFKPCPYRSKRESNCKQHMEKAHGWEYVRSKNNGKNREQAAPSNGLPTPQTLPISTPGEDEFDAQAAAERYMTFDQSRLNFADFGSSSDIDMDMLTSHHQLQLDLSPISDMNTSSSSNASPYIANQILEYQFQDVFRDDYQDLANANVDFDLYDDDIYSANMIHNLPTPNPEIFEGVFNTTFETSGLLYGTAVSEISPLGHGNAMLYTPPMSLDEGFEDFTPESDFQLFPSSIAGIIAPARTSALFNEIKINPELMGKSAQELLEFYTLSINAALRDSDMSGSMDWSSDDQMSGSQSQMSGSQSQ